MYRKYDNQKSLNSFQALPIQQQAYIVNQDQSKRNAQAAQSAT